MFLWLFLSSILGFGDSTRVQPTETRGSVFAFDVTSMFEREHLTSIAIDNRGLSYFAVTRGIVEFDGVEWRRIDVTRNAPIHLLTVNSEGRIFAGGENEFGFLAVDDRGNTLYESLSEKVTGGRFTGEIISIIPNGKEVYYLTADRVYRFIGRDLSEWPARGRFLSGAVFRNQLYAMEENSGLVVFDTLGNYKAVPGGGAFRSRIMLAAGEARLLLVSPSRGYFEATSDESGRIRVRPWGGSAFGLPAVSTISSIAGTAGVMAFGTLGDGVYFTDLNGTVIDHVTRADGLYSNFVYGVTFTQRNTLWAGHDNGVSLIEATRRIPALALVSGENGKTMAPSVGTVRADTTVPKKMETPSGSSWWSALTSWFSKDSVSIKPKIAATDFATIVRRVQLIRNDSTVFGGAFTQERLGVQDFEQSDTSRFVFDPDDNALRFSYATNEFESLGGIEFQAFLEGLDKEWSPWSTNTFREYTNLDFGQYTFTVRARNSLGTISREAKFRFEIDPPWHQAVWFYMLQLSIYVSLLIASYFMNKHGFALGWSEKIITILVVVSFEYLNAYFDTVFESIIGGVAFFAISINIIMALVLEPVQGWYEDFLKWIATREQRRLDRLHGKNPSEGNEQNPEADASQLTLFSDAPQP